MKMLLKHCPTHLRITSQAIATSIFFICCFLQTEQMRKAKTDKLQDEIDKLKEQLQLTRSQLETEQQAYTVQFSKVTG